MSGWRSGGGGGLQEQYLTSKQPALIGQLFMVYFCCEHWGTSALFAFFQMWRTSALQHGFFSFPFVVLNNYKNFLSLLYCKYVYCVIEYFYDYMFYVQCVHCMLHRFELTTITKFNTVVRMCLCTMLYIFRLGQKPIKYRPKTEHLSFIAFHRYWSITFII